MKKIELCNWSEYQHYKDRCPPWIKLHSNLLNSQMWVMLDDASRLLAIALMVLASKNNNEIPADTEYIKRVAHLKKADLKPLIDIDFCRLIADDSDVLADASALLSSPLLSSDSSLGESEGCKPKKKGYGEFKNVKLSDEEYVKLKMKQGEGRLLRGIEILGDYMRSKGKTYKCHYSTLKENSWVWERVGGQATEWVDPNPDSII